MPVTDAPDPPVVDFLRTAALSKLVASARLEEVVSAATSGDARRAGPVAEYLVKIGELTRFQADKLLAGVWQGLVIGHFRVLCPLGRGGMGVVYLAKDDRAPHPGSLEARRTALAALKVLPPARAKREPRTLARFRREMQLGRGLPAHPSLARILDAGEDAKVHFLAMEYVPGPTLRQTIADSGKLPIGSACRIFAEVAGGLHAAHEAGVVHRDVKPSNVIVSPFGPAKLLDFGFAFKIGETLVDDPAIFGGPGHTLGTMDYLAPEQAANARAVTRAADLYSLGCTLYFALAGCPPFPGGTAKDKIRWHRTDAPPPVASFNPLVPPGLVKLLDSLMAKDARLRPATAAAVAKALAEWADPPPPRPVGGAPPDVELQRRAEAKWLAAKGASADAGEDDDAPIFLDDTIPLPSLPTAVALPAVAPGEATPEPEPAPPPRRGYTLGPVQLLAAAGVLGALVVLSFLAGLALGFAGTR